ncbi:flagellin [uncultured Ramlibacter sp.]|uniref:flagellin n=1 Tax=uncultured Ramlibacter sp. TaxID=260755 RepID=UPI0026333A80|nr:flagellin [uncultured Ramlibacter sp.]
MPSVINTNITSLNTQRNLNGSQSSLATSIQRLSSGLRVNSARDDAAGLAIAERMNSQVRGLNVAARNANDGVSLAQTAEGALGKVGEMVQRMRELAVQSSNATNNATDRVSLQAEVIQLKQEIDRMALGTNFNGTKLLDGSFASARFQVGANAGESITIDKLTDAQLTSMGTIKAPAITGADVTDALNFTDLTAITAGDLEITVGTKTFKLDAIPLALTKTERQTQMLDAINKDSALHGVSAYLDATTNSIVMTSSADFKLAAVGATATVDTTGFTFSATVPPLPPGDEAASTSTDVSMIVLNVGSYEAAQLAMLQCDKALEEINSARATLGAVQSRFESTIANIQIASENTTAARSRIMDTDFAAETAAMTRAQILQQAGNAMLVQANQLPQQVLTLLRN